MGRPKKPPMDTKGQRILILGPRAVELEKETQDEIRVAVASAGGVMVMRNNNGVAKFGKRWVKYGLGGGSADLIAVVAPYGRFLGIEVKRPKGGRLSMDQAKWMDWIRLYGGVAGTAKNVAEAMALVDEARKLPWQQA